MKARIRFPYFGGLISLIGLPLLLGWHLLTALAYQPKYVMQVTWMPRDWWIYEQYLPFHTMRQYERVILTGNVSRDTLSLRRARWQMLRLSGQHDTINGIHFVLGKSARYGSIVKILDLADQVSLNSAPHYTGIWVWYHPRGGMPHFFPGPAMNCVPPVIKSNILSRLSFADLVPRLRSLWPSGVLLALLIGLSVRRHRKAASLRQIASLRSQ